MLVVQGSVIGIYGKSETLSKGKAIHSIRIGSGWLEQKRKVSVLPGQLMFTTIVCLGLVRAEHCSTGNARAMRGSSDSNRCFLSIHIGDAELMRTFYDNRRAY